MQARCKIHYCNTCKKGFAAWNPDSMKFWPPCVQKQLYRQVYIGRKSALARTLVQRAVREFPMGLAPGHMANEMNERKVADWRTRQCEYESRVSFERQRKQRTLQQTLQAGSTSGTATPWPAFDSALYDGRPLTAAILQTVAGLIMCDRVPRITLKIQHLHGKVWASDDSFKRAMRVRGPAVMDNTLGNEHHQVRKRFFRPVLY